MKEIQKIKGNKKKPSPFYQTGLTVYKLLIEKNLLKESFVSFKGSEEILPLI